MKRPVEVAEWMFFCLAYARWAIWRLSSEGPGYFAPIEHEDYFGRLDPETDDYPHQDRWAFDSGWHGAKNFGYPQDMYNAGQLARAFFEQLYQTQAPQYA